MSTKKATNKKAAVNSPYPQYALEKCLRIPRSILEQNAGKACSDSDSAKYSGVKLTGPFQMELSAAIKFGLLNRPVQKQVELTEISRKILKPLEKHDAINGYREAVLKAPVISEIYTHYRGENLPDSQFLNNTLTEKFKIPSEKVDEFKSILFDSLKTAELMSETDGKYRLVDISADISMHGKAEESFKKLEKSTHVKEGESCFVMMPFSDPLGSYC
ncbi:hypothetical protein JYT29_00245 [Nitrospina gracilis]|nr:hypothetical protein [Nitrospinaceae bacterium]MBN4077743.1 hypothetical protein [Nitrospina gracilis]